MDLLDIATRIAHPHPIDGIRALMQGSIKTDDSLSEAIEKKRYNTFVSNETIGKLQNIANAELKLSGYMEAAGTAEEQLEALRSSGFKGLNKAKLTLQDVYSLASKTRGKCARAQLGDLIIDFQREAANGLQHWQTLLEQAKIAGNHTEIELAETWLDGCKSHSQTTASDASQMTITDAFKAAASSNDCTGAQLKQLEDWVVATLALPARPETADAPYVAGDFPPLSRAAGGTNLRLAQAELSEVVKAVGAYPASTARDPLLPLLADLHARVGETMMHWLDEHRRLDAEAGPAPSAADAAELERIALFLGMTDMVEELDDVSETGAEDSPVIKDSRLNPSATLQFSHMSAAESFAKALEMGPLSDVHIDQLVSSFVDRHLLPDRPVQGTPYNVEELPDLYKRQRTPSLVAAQADLRDTITMIEACADDAAKSRLLPVLSDLQARVESADTAWQKLYAAYEELYAEEASLSRAEWMTRARLYIGAGAPAPRPVVAAVMKLMAKPTVSDADIAMVSELFTHVTGIPAGEIRRLDDFTLPDDNVLFQSLPEIIDELFDLREALLDVEDEAVQERLTGLLDSLTTTTQEANNFMLEENQRLGEGTRGITVNSDAIALTWKWIERPYAHDQGDSAPTDPGMPEAGEGADVVDDVSEGRRYTAQASNLFNQPEPDQQGAKREIFALDAASRASARIAAMR